MGHGDKVSPNPSFLKALQAQFSQPFLLWPISHSSDHLCGPSLDPLHIFFCVLGTKTEHSISGVAWQVLSRVRQWLPYLCWWCTWCNSTSCWLSLPWQHPGYSHWACCSPWPPELLELLLSWVGLCYTPALYFPRFKTLHLFLLNFLRFLSAHSSCRVVRLECQLPHSVWYHQWTSLGYTWPSSTSLVKVLSRAGPNIDPWGTPLVIVWEGAVFHLPLGAACQPVPHPSHGSLVYTITHRFLKKETVGNCIKSLGEIQVNNENCLWHINWVGFFHWVWSDLESTISPWWTLVGFSQSWAWF